MIDQPTDRLPTSEELKLWQLDLGKRIVRIGRDAQQQLTAQAQATLQAVQEKANGDD